jgi:hypothetical protein
MASSIILNIVVIKCQQFVCCYGFLVSSHLKISVTEQCPYIKIYVLLYKFSSGTLRMLQQADDKAAMKKSQVYEWCKCLRDEHDSAGFFCTTKHRHLGLGFQEVPYQPQCGSFGATAIFPGLATD